VKVELLYFDGCPNDESLLPDLERLLVLEGVTDGLELRRIESPEAAVRERFLGSPTVRVDGQDVEPGATERRDFGLQCRLYRTGERLGHVPSDEWIREALRRAH
jgi:hypothetical protein